MIEKLRPSSRMLIKWRKTYDYSQEAFAEYIGQPLERIQKWEKGSEKIPFWVHGVLHDPNSVL